MVHLFGAVNITCDIDNFVQISILLNKTKIVKISFLHIQILHIFGTIESTEKAEHILEMP